MGKYSRIIKRHDLVLRLMSTLLGLDILKDWRQYEDLYSSTMDHRQVFLNLFACKKDGKAAMQSIIDANDWKWWMNPMV